MKAMKNLMLASLLVGLGACSNHEQDVLETSKYITVDAGFGTDSRVATNGLVSVFEEDDAIVVYAWTGGSALPDTQDGFQVYNVKNVFDGTNWSATPQMLWKDGTTPHYFLAVYPPTDILTTKTYTIDPAKQEQSDLLVATNFGENNGGIAPQSNPVPLAFNHVMAKLRVNIQFNDEFAGTTPAVSSVTAEAKKTADIDWVTATATAKGDNAGVQLQSGTVAYSYESVMVPQNGFAGVAMVIDSETYTFTNTQDIQLKKGTITTLSLTVGRSAVEVGDITINDWTDGEAIAGYLKNIDEQIAAIQASVSELINVDATLQNLIDELGGKAADLQTQLNANATADAATRQALEAEIATLNTLIAALQAKDTELDGKITNLKSYVDTEIGSTKDWATATIATLVQYTDMQTELATLTALIETYKQELTDDYTDAIAEAVADMKTNLTALEASMKAWVNETLAQGYYDIATIDGKLDALQATFDALAANGATDQELADAITAQQAVLNAAKSELTAAYQQAIEEAINNNNGVINAKIAEAVKDAKDEQESKIDAINTEINAIKGRLTALEGKVSDLIARIQSIRFLPEYSDGKVKIEPDMSAVELTFIVSPEEAAKAIANAHKDDNSIISASIYRTESRAVDTPKSLEVTNVSGDDNGILTVTVNPSRLPADYWATNKTANIYIQINDGNNDITSEMIPVFYYVTCHLPKGTDFRSAILAALYNNPQLTKIEFKANSNEISGTQIGTCGAYLVPNTTTSTLEIHTSASVFVFPENCEAMFNGNTFYEETGTQPLLRVTSIKFNDCIDTSKVTSMNNMFRSLSALKELDLSCFDTSNVTDMGLMFAHCSKLEMLNLSSFNVNKVTNFKNMLWMMSTLENGKKTLVYVPNSNPFEDKNTGINNNIQQKPANSEYAEYVIGTPQ